MSSFVDNTGAGVAGVAGVEPDTGWEFDEVGVCVEAFDEREVSLVDAEDGDIGCDKCGAVVEGDDSPLGFFPLGDEAVSTSKVVDAAVEAAVVAEVAAKI